MKITSCTATLWLIVAAHVSAAQTPPPAAPTPAPAPHREVAPVERRVEVRAKVAGPLDMHPMMMMDAASMFLAHTGELQLTDAQVTRLAAIARRSEARQRAMRARMDSAMAMHKVERATPAPDGRGGAMTMMMMRMPMPTDAERKAQHEDNREAFSVPTPDQLATAYEMIMSHHGARGMMMKMPGR